MANFESTVTMNGIHMLTQAIGNGVSLVLTRAVIGDGKPTSGENPATFTALKNQTFNASLGEKSYVADTDTGYIQIPVQVTNSNVTAATYVREIGIYGKIGNDAETLYAYAYCTDPGDSGDNTLLPPPADVEYNVVRNYVIAVYISILDIGHITVNVSPSTMIKYRQMQEYVDPKIKHLQDAIDNIKASDVSAIAPAENKSWFNVQTYLTGIWESLKGLSGKKSSDFATAAQGEKADKALPQSSFTADNIFTMILGKDGAGSTLDADLLDGQHGSFYLNYNNFTNKPTIPTVPNAYTGTPSPLGKPSAGSSNYWARGDHIHQIPTPADIGALGSSEQAVDAAKLNGQAASYYLNYTNLSNKPTIYQPATATPKALGTATVGTGTTFARADHVHALPSLATLGAQKSITYGTAAPSGGSNGDIYIQY